MWGAAVKRWIASPSTSNNPTPAAVVATTGREEAATRNEAAKHNVRVLVVMAEQTDKDAAAALQGMLSAAAAEVDARAEAEDIAAQAKAAATARASHLQQSVDKLQFLAQAATSRAEVAELRARDRRRPQLRGLSEEVIAEALARYSQSLGRV